MAQPYYQVDFSASACLFELRVNDILVFTLNVEGQTSTLIPINLAILQSGKQQINIRVLPLAGEHTVSPKAEFKYDIKVFDVTNDFQFKEQLPGYQFPPVDASIPHPVLVYDASFNAEVPYTIQAYQNGIDLKSIDDLNAKVKAAYQRVADIIDRKDYEQFKKVMANREKVIATAMYLSPKESADRVNDLIIDFESGFKVEPITPNAVVHVYALGKVAALKKLNGESALALLNKTTQEELMIELSFYMPQGKAELEIM
ncbi:MAG: hypothetical protein JWR38_4243 [Mucilaginibacter sp.]|nr:hypothetical protein [Mucilaginibacter sp.]